MNIQLTPDDPRLGSFDEDGALIRPVCAIDGSVYSMNECGLRYLAHNNERYFVVVPVLFVEPFTVEIVTPKAVKPKAAKVNDDE